jgi:hypothetical protein
VALGHAPAQAAAARRRPVAEHEAQPYMTRCRLACWSRTGIRNPRTEPGYHWRRQHRQAGIPDQPKTT